MHSPRSRNWMGMNQRRADDGSRALADIASQVERISSENEQLFRRLLDGERRFRGLARSVWQVQEEERRRLARELHDSIGQTLVGLIHQVERLGRRVEDDGTRRLATDIEELARQALDETRELSRLLRPPVLDDLGLGPALAWLVRTLGERTDLRAELETDLGEARLDAELETLVFRVVQEALSNAIRHAPGARVTVRATLGRASLVVEIRDDGPGFDTREVLSGGGPATSAGLRGMRDRVELFGGRLEIRSVVGEGTTVGIKLPLAAEGET